MNRILLKARCNGLNALRKNRAILALENSTSVRIHLVAFKAFVSGVFKQRHVLRLVQRTNGFYKSLNRRRLLDFGSFIRTTFLFSLIGRNKTVEKASNLGVGGSYRFYWLNSLLQRVTLVQSHSVSEGSLFTNVFFLFIGPRRLCSDRTNVQPGRWNWLFQKLRSLSRTLFKSLQVEKQAWLWF